MAPIRIRHLSTQALRPVRAMALVLVIASLLATSCTADEAVTDLEVRCQNVQCYNPCPSDSYPSNTLGAADGGQDNEADPSETSTPADEGDRVKRAIATNNDAHGPIKITPGPSDFFYSKILHRQRHRRRRDIDPAELVVAGMDYIETDFHLQDLCCPKSVCVCLPCPEPSCQPNYKPVIDVHEQTGQPGKCCPSYHCEPLDRMCSTVTQQELRVFYKENATWHEPPCRSCRCEAGESRCVEPACKPLNCEHKIDLPNQCCPVCDPAKSIFCEEHNCELRCRYGYVRRGDCALCSCVHRMPSSTTDLSVADSETTETTALVFTADTINGDGTASYDVTGTAEQDEGDGFFSNLSTALIWFAVIIVALLSACGIHHVVTIECVKKGLKILFSCNQIPKRKSAYNRVSSTVPVTPTANETAANSMA